jgi:hypothetical protein
MHAGLIKRNYSAGFLFSSLVCAMEKKSQLAKQKVLSSLRGSYKSLVIAV